VIKPFIELTAAGTVQDLHLIPFSFRIAPETVCGDESKLIFENKKLNAGFVFL